MKIFALCGVLALAAFPALAYDITINITGVESNKGEVSCLLFNKKEGFPDNPDKKFGVDYHPANPKGNVCSFKNVPAGTYAVSVLHDINANQKLEKNFVGYPLEPWGVSNNVRAALAPPSFKSAQFELKSNLTLSVKVAK